VIVEKTQFSIATGTEDIVIKETRLNGIIHPVEAPARSEERMTTEIPISKFARIRAWVEYGMTAAQVAAVYGVAVGAIERILRQA
jgi:hypothetical protein